MSRATATRNVPIFSQTVIIVMLFNGRGRVTQARQRRAGRRWLRHCAWVELEFAAALCAAALCAAALCAAALCAAAPAVRDLARLSVGDPTTKPNAGSDAQAHANRLTAAEPWQHADSDLPLVAGLRAQLGTHPHRRRPPPQAAIAGPAR